MHCYMCRVGQSRVYTHCYMCRVGQDIRTATCVGSARTYALLHVQGRPGHTHCYMCRVGQDIRTATCVGLARIVYIYTVYDRSRGDFPAKNNNIYTPCIL